MEICTNNCSVYHGGHSLTPRIDQNCALYWSLCWRFGKFLLQILRIIEGFINLVGKTFCLIQTISLLMLYFKSICWNLVKPTKFNELKPLLFEKHHTQYWQISWEFEHASLCKWVTTFMTELGLFLAGLFPAALFPADFFPLGLFPACLFPARSIAR